MSVVVQVDRLSKQYRLGQIGGKRLVDDVNRWWARLRGKEDPLSKVGSLSPRVPESRGPSSASQSPLVPKSLSPSLPSSETLWALKDVSFEVKQGEVLGIIGRNGAGKSTLLKILSRVTAPTSGEVRVKGRIASLLEVGTGFHPELTGRENIFLNGAILGMTKAEIRSKFDEIVAFAEVEKFIDTPVKRYSSGMYVRLAFAVAAHLEPEILIVDEVLAVGDAEFQKRCHGKMHDVAGQGRTILFVSHNMVALGSLCQRAILLAEGKRVADGPAEETISKYLHLNSNSTRSQAWPEGEQPGNHYLRIRGVKVFPKGGTTSDPIEMTSDVMVEVEYSILQARKALHITYHLINEQGIIVLTSFPPTSPHEPGTYRALCCIQGSLLNSGSYFVNLLAIEDNSRRAFRLKQAAGFEVVDGGKRTGGWMGREPGVVVPFLNWSTEKLLL